MLPSKNRLKLSFAENKATWGGKRLHSDELQLIITNGPGPFKIATIVSKKVAPKAVDRNRIRRLVAHAAKEIPKLEAHIIVIVKKNIADLNKNEVKAKLTRLLQELK